MSIALPMSEVLPLERIIQVCPIIDHHGHQLLRLGSVKKVPLLSISTEANGEAIAATTTSLAHLRAVKQLSSILGCEATWTAVEAAIAAKRAGDYKAWTKRCLEGIESVLVDDGFGNQEDLELYNHFDDFTRSPTKRIVRIEQVAANIIDEIFAKPDTSFDALHREVHDRFHAYIVQAIIDPAVVAFKSIICYRSGLAIRKTAPEQKSVKGALQSLYDGKKKGKTLTRLNNPELTQYFVHKVAQLIVKSAAPYNKKPIQFHTGLGDNDIILTTATPALLQPFITAYPKVNMVLLHASYPFMREAAYLATVYPNVYADIGEVFPAVSRDGQEAVIRQMLELCPYSKLLWSTDGHYFPETYLLAVEQVREVLRTVLLDYVGKGDLTFVQAADLVQAFFFNNANKLYNLGLELSAWTSKPSLEPAPAGWEHIQTLTKFLNGHQTPRFFRVYWNDMTATSRMRAVPMRRVWSILRSGEELSFGVTKASLGLLQNDVPVPGVTPSGEYKLHPDLTTLRLGPRKGHITAQGDFKEKDGSLVPLCPRTLLKRAIGEAAQHGLEFIIGFEVELVLARRVGDESKYMTLDGDGHAWSVGRAMEHEAVTEVLEEAIEQLEVAGVYVDMMHPESATGQYEVVLPKAPPLEAVDTLLYARDVISNCATEKGYRMTLHPKPYARACGSASHTHISISTPNGYDRNVYEAFYAGILKHLGAITAFSIASVVSYERMQDGCWAGGTWVAWGTQNRETPLRKIEDSHWELKCMDGTANPYLALSATLFAGTQGVVDGEKLVQADCQVDPATLSEAERQRLNVVKKLPSSVSEALQALEGDEDMTKLLGRELVERFVAVKKAETAMLEGMSDEERRRWVMERY